MRTKDLMREIELLPLSKQMVLIERTLRSIREHELNSKMSMAVKSLMDDYRSDKELTAFTALDMENFYETR